MDYEKEFSFLSGYASLFKKPDCDGDIVMPGAFARSIKQKPAEEIKMLYQHDVHCPVGLWKKISEDRHGLYVEGLLMNGIEKGKEAGKLIGAGILTGLSIGFRTLRATKPALQRGRLLQEIDLWEISLVTFPSDPNAKIQHFRQFI